jgi:NAD(P)-dependent dehydrogenase (short-subunit alcohol dehydrogenase family)
MIGKVVLVTGATSGIGRQTAIQLARRGATVIVHGRRPERVAAAVDAVRAAAPAETTVLSALADLSSQKQVRELAAQVLQLAPRLDVLINNAGVIVHRRHLTEDGLEYTFAVDHLAAFLLTDLLLSRLVEAAPARVITVSSTVHQSGFLDFDDLQGERHFRGGAAYAAAKLANVLFAVELAGRLQGRGVTSNCLHPGAVNTRLLRHGWLVPFGAPPSVGARTSVYLASAPELADVTGAYFHGRRRVSPAAAAADADLRRRLWEESARLSGLA